MTAGTIYTFPVHPEVRRDHPGNCLKCGMNLRPVLPALQADNNESLRICDVRTPAMPAPLSDGAVGQPPSVRFDRFQSSLRSLLMAACAMALALAFATLGGEVAQGETRSFDMQWLQWAQALRAGHPGSAEVMRDFSGLGSTAVLTFLTVSTVGYLVLVSARATAILVAASVISGTLLVDVFKATFGRARPDAAYAEFLVNSPSFPSGHASMSALVFLTLGALIAWTCSHRAPRIYILVIAALMTALVGLSRVGLGVHWATDVLGGWALGAAWAMLWLLIARNGAKRI